MGPVRIKWGECEIKRDGVQVSILRPEMPEKRLGSSNVLRHKNLVAFRVAIDAEEDRLAFTLLRRLQKDRTGQTDRFRFCDHIFKLKRQSGGIS